jgi:arginyl-tRNA synthetase
MEAYLKNIFSFSIEIYDTLLKLNYYDKPENKYEKSFDNFALKDNDISSCTKFADYQFNGLMRYYHYHKGTTRLIGETSLIDFSKKFTDIILKADESSMIAGISLNKNFVNITINTSFIFNEVISCGSLIKDEGLKGLINSHSPCEKIIVDYSSPNVAKSLHVGHLRSTIIGESITRLLKTIGHEVIGLNHIGDWGTQFGMIINYIKKNISSDQESIVKYLDEVNSDNLMKIYRDAKKLFDENNFFSDESREQTFKLQQGDELNTLIWKKICEISSKEYSKIYDILNVRNLLERGESFYQPIIPKVLELLTNDGLLKDQNGAKIIFLDNWTFPLIIVKSDGAYTYDTTDIAALYHRLCVLNADRVIYLTDSGQKSHFDMCFEVAKHMKWTNENSNNNNDNNNNKKLVHIGFGVVCGKDGSKLKTRSGETVQLLSVINEVIQLSEKIINDRLKTQTNSDTKMSNNIDDDKGNDDKDDDDLKTTSRKIGINTLKYFDLSHAHASNYTYDPELMFRFNGDTGVYLMYCYARINSIIEKSSYDLNTLRTQSLQNILKLGSDDHKLDETKIMYTKETRALMVHIINLRSYLDIAIKELNTNVLTKYVFSLCTLFNGYVTQKNGKIIKSETEVFGICMCLITSKIIELIFDILGFDKVQHI